MESGRDILAVMFLLEREVDRQLNELFELIDVDRLKEAGDLLRKLRGKYGDSLPELARAEAMLNCLI